MQKRETKQFVLSVALGLSIVLYTPLYAAPSQNSDFQDTSSYINDMDFQGMQDEKNIQDGKQKDSSANEIGRSFNLVELLEGAKKNYNLEAKDIAILQAKANSRAAWGEVLPTLDGAYQYQDSDNPSMRLKAHTSSVKGSWEVFSGFKTYNKIKEKNALYRASIEDKQSSKDQLFLNVIDEYYAYFTNRAQLASLEQKKFQLETNIKRSERLYKSGLATIDDVESLRAEVLSTDYDIANVKMSIEQNKLLLSLYANVEVSELERNTIKPPLLTLDENRHDLKMLAEQALGAKYQARQITYLPTVTISDTYVVNSDIGKPGALTIKDPNMANMGQGFSMTDMMRRQYPLNQNQIMINATIHLDALTTYRQYEASRLGYLKSLKELAYKKEEQKKDERVYRKGLEIAVAKIKASEAALRSANIAFENVAKKYDSQILNFTDYLQSITKKFESEATYNQALNDYEKQKAYYIYYSGQDLEQYIK